MVRAVRAQSVCQTATGSHPQARAGMGPARGGPARGTEDDGACSDAIYASAQRLASHAYTGSPTAFSRRARLMCAAPAGLRA